MRRSSPLPHLLLAVAILAALPARGESSATETRTIRFSCATHRASGADDAGTRLCQMAEAGELNDLHWPNFTNYREQVRQFYSPAFALAWSNDGVPTTQARALIESFQHAEEKGLEPEDYDASRWADRLAHFSSDTPRSPEELAHFDLELTVSALRYVSHLHHGRLKPEFQSGLKTASFDAAAFLKRQIVGAEDVSTALAQAEPAWPGYKRALKALQNYLVISRGEITDPLPHGDQDVYPDSSYSGVMQMAAKLRRTGDLPVDTKIARPEIYEEPLVSAVKHFEGRNGIEPDGILGPDTYRELDTPLAHRAVQLKLALERWRWLPTELGSRFIIVNIPEFRLRAFEDHQPTFTMRAIVGDATGHQTPMFANLMDSIVFRPAWNVPLKVQRSELLPDIRKEAHYLPKHQMEVVNGAGRVVTADLLTPVMLQQLDSGRLAIRQQPGPDNSLGLIKFVFPNEEGIYLHGTPDKNLFSSYRRDFSHGCVRLEDPAALAAWVLHDRPAWTPARIDTAMQGPESFNVKIANPIPVLIIYQTAVVEENGDVHFFDDIYSEDATMEKALAAARP